MKERRTRKVEMKEVEMVVEPPVTYSAPRGWGAADCWLTMVGGGVWNTGQERMSTSVCTDERTSENTYFSLFALCVCISRVK